MLIHHQMHNRRVRVWLCLGENKLQYYKFQSLTVRVLRYVKHSFISLFKVSDRMLSAMNAYAHRLSLIHHSTAIHFSLLNFVALLMFSYRFEFSLYIIHMPFSLH
jgi:hypothetical protein